MDKKMYDYWLYGLSSIGRKTFLKLNENGFNSAYLYKCREERLPTFLNEKQKASIIKGQEKSEESLKNAYEKLRANGIFMTVFGDDDYPKKLYKIPDAPAVLFYKGTLPSKEQKAIAIIGARNCSEYGRLVAEAFAACFAKNGISVISGMANGIDGFAQKAALLENGYSVGVLGSGVNVCYPMENYELYKQLTQKGCVLSEYLPDVQAAAKLFPPRNRIISGLSDALLVVEAKEKSGTLITVEMALEQGKEVYVVPGRITDELSRGCHKLLWEGAYPAVSPEKMLESLYGTEVLEKKERKDGLSVNDREKEKLRKRILSFLEITPVHINVLQEQTGLPMELLCRELLFMNMDGLVVQKGSNWYQKVR